MVWGEEEEDCSVCRPPRGHRELHSPSTYRFTWEREYGGVSL